jgi:hypothetical protein
MVMYRYVEQIDIYIKYVDILASFRQVIKNGLLTHMIKTAPTSEGKGYFDQKTACNSADRGASPIGESKPKIHNQRITFWATDQNSFLIPSPVPKFLYGIK